MRVTANRDDSIVVYTDVCIDPGACASSTGGLKRGYTVLPRLRGPPVHMVRSMVALVPHYCLPALKWGKFDSSDA